MDLSAIRINPKRLQKDLVDLGGFGEVPGGGLVRTALSDADLGARRWFKSRMEDAGLRVREDAVANLIGRLDPSEGSPSSPCIGVGSHIDSVPNGGKFDGALGLCVGLEAVRAIRESGLPLPCPLELLVFTDEEGNHYAGTFGSRAMLDLLLEREIYCSRSEDQPSLASDLLRIGKDPARIGDAVRRVTEFRAFLEVHIEQGPILNVMNIPIGIVEGIVFLERHIIRVIGQSGHAGTTPMHLRDDALVKAARIVTEVNEALVRSGTGIVGTFGNLQVYPGAFNIISGRVDMLLDLRSMDELTLASGRDTIRKIVESEKNVQTELILSKGGVSMDADIMQAIEDSCRERGIPCTRMGSGAGHDAMSFQTRGIPTGMIFIPCEEGKSHGPEETICWEDATRSAQVLADSVFRIGFGNRRGKGVDS
jgi:N-carbamoyl-L-amino-acid hydrolase